MHDQRALVEQQAVGHQGPRSGEGARMILFLFEGRDPSSDTGSFEILIQAETFYAARKMAKSHLIEAGRDDLLPVMSYIGRCQIRNGVAFTSVETR